LLRDLELDRSACLLLDDCRSAPHIGSRTNIVYSQPYYARNLLSIARLKIARSRLDRAISRRTRMDQTCLGSRGFFWPTSNPLFQGRWPPLIQRADIGGAPPSRPPRRSIASASFYTRRRSPFDAKRTSTTRSLRFLRASALERAIALVESASMWCRAGTRAEAMKSEDGGAVGRPCREAGTSSQAG
jgi:hypothetical protein